MRLKPQPLVLILMMDDYYQDTTEQSIASNPSGKTKLFLQQGTLCLKVAKILQSRKE